jgi:hypothetical protein
MSYLLKNFSPEILVFLSVGFLILGLVWYNTGRFFLIGWIVKLLWLFTIAPLAFVIWLFASITNSIFDTIRGVIFFVWLVRGVLVFADWYAMNNPEYNDFLPLLLVVSFLFFYLTKYGLPEQKFSRWIKSSPKARRTPTARPKLKPLKTEPMAEDLPRPEVKPLLKKQGYFETEAEIKTKLDEHLQRLINGG